MARKSVGPEDGARYAKVKGKLKNKGAAGRDPKALKRFEKHLAKLRQDQAKVRTKAYDPLVKQCTACVKLGKKLLAAKVPDEKKMDAAELAAKFPGGIVPKKMPRRTMGGRVKTRGGR